MPYDAVIFDFGGVLTTSLDECARTFARQAGLPDDAYLHAIAVDPRGRRLYARLELGEITQEAWNEGIARLLGIDGTDLMRRALATLRPEPAVIHAARMIRAAGLKTAVLSNSMGMNPFNPYEPWHLHDEHDVVVLSEQVRMRKPDDEIYQLVLDQLGCPGQACIFVDDIDTNLHPATKLGMATILAQEPGRTVQLLQDLLGLPLPPQTVPNHDPERTAPGRLRSLEGNPPRE